MSYYALTPSIDAATGDLVLGDDGAPVEGQPMAEVVSFICRTPRGQYGPDPETGITVPTKSQKNSGSDLAASIREGLGALIRTRRITDVAITTEDAPPQIRFEVAFKDPQDNTGRTERGSV